MNTKNLIINRLENHLDHRIQLITQAINNAKESRDNETKSSAGDKYETGRAMMQMEIEKNLAQLGNLQKQKNDLSGIDPKKTSTTVGFGSLVRTSMGNYFFSIGYGKIEVEGEAWFCVSLYSPIGLKLLNKTVNDQIQFQGKEIHILGIE